jgi:putative hemin transport protein
MNTSTTTSLKEKWAQLKSEQPKLRIRDAAKQLDSTEAELLATQIGENVIRLNDQFKELLLEVINLGHVMALTRNDYAVHERKGEYLKTSFNGHLGLVLGEDIDLRLFMQAWKYGFAVQEADRKSLQFFDLYGVAVHKIYLTEKSNVDAYAALVDKYKATSQTGFLEISIEEVPEVELPDTEINVAEFQQAWKELKDTHDFFGMLRKYRVSRTQAMRLAPSNYVRKVEKGAVNKMLRIVAELELPIMVFVGSRGCIQIHTGEVKNIVEAGPWLNVLDPLFNLHLRMDAIADAWIVTKPTEDGEVNSLELFDDKGENIALFFGKRKPGIPEKQEWRHVLASIK